MSFLRLITAVGICACVFGAMAAERYDYDPLGRLIRRIDDQNRVTEYVYDPSGNILAVRNDGVLQPPASTTVDPSSARQNQVLQVTVSGTGLTGATVRTDSPDLVVSGVAGSPTSLSFKLTVRRAAAVGGHVLTIANAAGSLSLPFEILPAEAIVAVPLIIQIPPDNLVRQFGIQLGEPRAVPTTFDVRLGTTDAARLEAGQLTIAAGSLLGTVGIAGLKEGSTYLRFSHPSLAEPTDVLVFVRASFASPALIGSHGVGVVRETPWANAPGAMTVMGPVGIVRGLPYAASAAALSVSGPIGIARGLPYAASSGALAVSGPIGVARGLPWTVAPAALDASGPVGIVK